MNIIIILVYKMSTQAGAQCPRKRSREGRWTPAQADLFEQLIQKYGKNWKKIQSFIPGRTLSQIRSHAQKFFRKVGEGRVREFERKAKLLEALDTLEKEKLRQATTLRGELEHRTNLDLTPKQEEEGASGGVGSLGSAWESAGESGVAGEPRASQSRRIKEQFSLVHNRESQAPPAQTPTENADKLATQNEFLPAPYLPLPTGFSYYFLPAQPNPYFSGFNYPLNQ